MSIKNSNILKKLKHKIIISDYKLHEYTDFSKCFLRFEAGNRINANIKNAFFVLVFWILIFTLYYLVYYFLTDLKNSMPNYIFVISLILSAVFYTFTMLIFPADLFRLF